MQNPTDTTPEREGQDSWPREVLIQPTAEKAIEMLGVRYDRSRDPEGDDAIAFEIGYEMRITAEINSWEDFDRKYDGYQLVDSELQKELLLYLEIKHQDRHNKK